MPAFKNKNHCTIRICILVLASMALAVIATYVGSYFGSLLGAVIGWIYATALVWFVLDHSGQFFENAEIRTIREHLSDYDNKELSLKNIDQNQKEKDNAC